MIKIFFLTLLFNGLLFTNASLAQELLKLDNGCNYAGDTIKPDVYSFESDGEAGAALKRVMKYTGLPANFIIKAADVPNAQASIYRSTRYVFYNQLFMMRVKQQTNTDWSSISILAHEIGHHLSGHTLDSIGSRPIKELEADRFSGFVLAKMGATIEEALVAMNNIANEQGSFTHPPRSARIAAITNGWQAALDIEKIPEKKNIVTEEKKISKPLINATIEDISFEGNAYQDGVKGMLIHLKFNTTNMQYIKGSASAYFYFNNGTKLKDFNGIYSSADGQVSSGTDFTPPFEKTSYKELTIFIPHSEIHINRGTHDLKFHVIIWEYSDPNNGRAIAESVYKTFRLTAFN